MFDLVPCEQPLLDSPSVATAIGGEANTKAEAEVEEVEAEVEAEFEVATSAPAAPTPLSKHLVLPSFTPSQNAGPCKMKFLRPSASSQPSTSILVHNSFSALTEQGSEAAPVRHARKAVYFSGAPQLPDI